MATERELKTSQEATLFDIFRLMEALDEKEMRRLLELMALRAQSGMTVEEIALVKVRAETSAQKERELQ